MTKYEAITLYSYYDGPAVATIRQHDSHQIYLVRWYDDAPDGSRIYKADGFDLLIHEDEILWKEVEV